MIPQKAEPIPNSSMPEEETSKVMSAGSRCDSSSRAPFRLEPIVPMSANPAIAKISALGKTEKKATTVEPKTAIKNQQSPANTVAR